MAGVHAVEKIRFRRRGFFTWRTFGWNEAFYDPGVDTILRLQNDRFYPDRGSLKIITEGGPRWQNPRPNRDAPQNPPN